MVNRLKPLPTWTLALLIWMPVAAFTFVVGLFTEADLLWTTGFAVLIGLLIAIPCAFALRTRWRLQDDALGDVPADLRRSATRAAWTGPIPADPETREAAIRLAERHLQQAHRVRPWMYVALAGLLISAIANAVLDPWNLLSTIFWLPLAVLFFTTPKHLRHRIALLSAPR